MKYVVRAALVLAAAAVLGLACGKKTKVSQATAFPDSIVGSELIAVVNGDSIWGKDLQVLAYVSMVGPDSLHSPSFNTKLLDQMIDRFVFVKEARAAGTTAPDSIVDMMMKQFTANFSKELAGELGQQGLKPVDFRRAIQRDLLIRSYVREKIQPSITISDADCRAYFDEHKDQFAGMDSVRVRHIILQNRPADTDKDLEQRKQLLESIRKRVLNGEKFAPLAKMYSEDSSAERGGDLGFFARGQMVREFEDVAFGLKKGEVSPVFKTQFGYHLVQCVDKKAPGPPVYENAKPRIEAMLKQQALGTDLQNRLKRNRETATIVRNYQTGA
ncbi:MAG TPA: peptidylprolyl isomerase [Candidatus Krumholzibacteria bacterium]|nr:peptidylprolyl isomerase [Candidatus Krumholzibacteria bacterium]